MTIYRTDLKPSHRIILVQQVEESQERNFPLGRNRCCVSQRYPLRNHFSSPSRKVLPTLRLAKPTNILEILICLVKLLVHIFYHELVTTTAELTPIIPHRRNDTDFNHYREHYREFLHARRFVHTDN